MFIINGGFIRLFIIRLIHFSLNTIAALPREWDDVAFLFYFNMPPCFPLHKRFLTSIAICFENRLLVNKNVNSPLQLSANSFPNGKSGSESPEIDRPFISQIFFAFSHFILTRRPVSLHTTFGYHNVRLEPGRTYPTRPFSAQTTRSRTFCTDFRY